MVFGGKGDKLPGYKKGENCFESDCVVEGCQFGDTGHRLGLDFTRADQWAVKALGIGAEPRVVPNNAGPNRLPCFNPLVLTAVLRLFNLSAGRFFFLLSNKRDRLRFNG